MSWNNSKKNWAFVSALLLPVVLYGQGVEDRHRAINTNLSEIQSRSSAPGYNGWSNDIGLLTGSFRGLSSYTRNYQQADYDRERDLVNRTMAWLATAEAAGVRNPALGRNVAGAYGFLGDWQTRPEFQRFGYGGAALGYRGAARVSRRLYLYNGGDYSRDVERFAMSIATLNAAYAGIGNAHRERPATGLDAVEFDYPDPNRKPVAVPRVETSKWSSEQRDLWKELMPQFVAVSNRVFEAQNNMDALSARLRKQGLTMNANDMAIGYQMQGFLEDAADLCLKGDLKEAKIALDKAAYNCDRLRRVVG